MAQQQMIGLIDIATSGPAFWRAAWSRRHTAVAVVSGSALLVMLLSARQPTGGLDVVLLVLAAAVGAVTLGTYVPPAGVPLREHLTGGSCGVIPALVTLGAPVMMAQAPLTVAPLLLLLACYAFAAGKRITDHASC